MVTNGATVTLKLLTGGSCACSGDVLTITTPTCTAIPYMNAVTHNGTRDMYDYTGFNDKIRKMTPGMPSVTVDLSGYLDLSNSVQLGLWNSQSCSTPTQRIFRYYDGNKTITVKGYLNGFTGGYSVGALTTAQTSLTATYLPKTC